MVFSWDICAVKKPCIELNKRKLIMQWKQGQVTDKRYESLNDIIAEHCRDNIAAGELYAYKVKLSSKVHTIVFA